MTGTLAGALAARQIPVYGGHLLTEVEGEIEEGGKGLRLTKRPATTSGPAPSLRAWSAASRSSGPPTSPRCRGRPPDGAPDLLGAEGHVQGLDAEGREGVPYGVDDGLRSADAAGLAHPLGAERVVGRGRDRVIQLEHRQVGGLRRGVFHEAARQELARLVVDDLFPQGLGDSLGVSPVELPPRDP